MTRVLDVDGTMFKHEEYVDYSHARTNAGGLAVFAVLLAVVGIYQAPRVSGILYAVLYVGWFGAVYLWLIRTAWDEWDRAKSIRRQAEIRQEAGPILATILAGVVLKTLQKLAEGVEKEGTVVADVGGEGE